MSIMTKATSLPCAGNMRGVTEIIFLRTERMHPRKPYDVVCEGQQPEPTLLGWYYSSTDNEMDHKSTCIIHSQPKLLHLEVSDCWL